MLGNYFLGSLFLIFLTQNPLFIGLAVAAYIVLFIVVKMKKESIVGYLEQAGEIKELESMDTKQEV